MSITTPEANEVWLAGSDHTLTCTSSYNYDRCRADAQSQWQILADSVTQYWTGTGTFKDNDNIGTSVTYICTNTAGNNTVTTYADDDYAPVLNAALVDEPAKSDTKVVAVVIPTLEWVEFGGTNKHTLYKKDANPWNIANEDCATDYTTAVPDKAWVRDPALTDPVCYTKGSTGAQVTTSINFASQAITKNSTFNIDGTTGVNHVFVKNGINVIGAQTTVPAMNAAVAFGNSVSGSTWYVYWSYKVPTGTNTWIALGFSQNYCYTTWGTTAGSVATARRMNWSAYLKCNNDACHGSGITSQ